MNILPSQILFRCAQFEIKSSMTKGSTRILVILVTFIVVVAFAVYHFGHFFSERYLPPKVTVTKNEIIGSGGFMNSITIEKLKVDSFGKDKRPTNYTIEYLTTCFIKQKDGEPPVALKEIKLDESGRYIWSEEIAHISVAHAEGSSKRITSTQRIIVRAGLRKFDICPVKFENGNWYFLDFQDPVFIGIYLYVDENGTIHQYDAYSGELPF